MPFSLEGQPYRVQTLDSGLQVALTPHIAQETSVQLNVSGKDSVLVPYRDSEYYPHLLAWMKPVLEAQKLSMSSIFSEPKDLPATLRDLPQNAATALIVNVFPVRGERWLFTTSGLAQIGLARDFRSDNHTYPSNHQICVPVAFRRLGLIDDSYFKNWKLHIDTSFPDPVPSTIPWTSHMMSIFRDEDSGFIIGDQYGVARVDDEQLIKMAQIRNSFNGKDMYHARVFESAP
ncbi:MAG: hypothetical protein WBO77_04120 [Microgenomates group bacterium]